jgi:Ca2+-binding EF-hand superfamily protein
MPMGKSESPEKSKEAFGKIDTDGNGSLSKDEMNTFGEKMSSEMQSMMISLQSMSGGQKGGGMGGGMGEIDIDALFGNSDGDKNGSISRDEFNKARENDPLSKMLSSSEESEEDDAFNMIDADGDGSLSKDEVTEFTSKMQDEMQKMMGGGGQSAEFTKALSAYRSGSGGETTDLTQTLLKMLDGSKQGNSVTA